MPDELVLRYYRHIATHASLLLKSPLASVVNGDSIGLIRCHTLIVEQRRSDLVSVDIHVRFFPLVDVVNLCQNQRIRAPLGYLVDMRARTHCG